jgi:hypothetical protein
MRRTMAIENRDRQTKYREKMYKIGLINKLVWIPRKNSRVEKNIRYPEFNKTFRHLTENWNKRELSRILNLFIKITKAHKEVKKLRETF